MILAVDPGTLQSGWCLFANNHVKGYGVSQNPDMLTIIRDTSATVLAIERVASYGMSVGREVFETCEWVGDFRNEWRRLGKGEAVLVYRKDVKLHLCGSSRAKDSNVRQALIDLFEPTGGGKCRQIGVKGKPGPLFGVSSHAWPALGVAVTATASPGRGFAARA